MKKFAFYTLGCRANQYQSFALKCQILRLRSGQALRQSSGELSNDKNQIVDFGQPSDVCIINTCTVTQDADRKSRQAIRRALRLAKKVIVTGCSAKLKGKELKALFPQIELLDSPSLTPHTSHLPPRIRSNLMIQDGCENFCSYCIVPYARGKIKSKPPLQIIEEAKLLVEAGAREIILTGINLGTYGKNVAATFRSPKNGSLKTAATLPNIIQQLSKIENLYRIRLSSIEPMYLTKKLIDDAARIPKVCRHLHIPLQSGDDSILSAMNRNYSGEKFLEMIDYIRKKIPECGITTDIIVGLPGEGEKEFKNTLKLAEKAKFSRIHIFPYSKREGTKAASFKAQVDPQIKKERFKRLNKLRAKLMKEFAESYLEKEVEILVEQLGEGLTDNFIRVKFNDPQDLSGKLHKLILKPNNLLFT